MLRVLMLNNEFPPLGGRTGSVNQALMDRLASTERFEIDLVMSAHGREPEQVSYTDRIRIFKVPVNNQICPSEAREGGSCGPFFIDTKPLFLYSDR